MNYRSIGITGSREGLSTLQRMWLIEFLKANTTKVLHHGDCIGVDDEVALLFKQIDKSYIIAHPGHIAEIRARSHANDLTMHWANTLVRNRMIVNHSELMLAFPLTRNKQLRSGTWHAIEYAIKQEVNIIIIGPNGKKVTFPE